MKKDFNDGSYWDAFGRGHLKPEDRPTPEEAAEHVIRLIVQIEALRVDVAHAQKQEKIAKQQFSVFAMEVGNIARRYEIP